MKDKEYRYAITKICFAFQLANELSKICDLLVPGNEDLHAQCTDLFTEYFDSIWELIVNKFMRAELVCSTIGACP